MTWERLETIAFMTIMFLICIILALVCLVMIGGILSFMWSVFQHPQGC
jgi:hypothetical protein